MAYIVPLWVFIKAKNMTGIEYVEDPYTGPLLSGTGGDKDISGWALPGALSKLHPYHPVGPFQGFLDSEESES